MLNWLLFKYWLRERIDKDAKFWYKLWSVRLALFWMAVMGAFMALPSFQEYMTPEHFLGVCIFGTMTIGIARLTHQPGID